METTNTPNAYILENGTLRPARADELEDGKIYWMPCQKSMAQMTVELSADEDLSVELFGHPSAPQYYCQFQMFGATRARSMHADILER